jgi:hypothetical protein
MLAAGRFAPKRDALSMSRFRKQQAPLIPAKAGIQRKELGPRFHGDERPTADRIALNTSR